MQPARRDHDRFGEQLGESLGRAEDGADPFGVLGLVLDFGTIEAGVRMGAPKELEWYLAFGLMVTLVWLYISILKLLALLARNR